ITENFRARCVIKAHRLCFVARDLEQPQRRHSRFIARRFGNFETQPDVALPGKRIKLGWPDFTKNAAQSRGVRKIAVMEKQTFAVNLFVATQMFDARAEEIARATNHTV